jgi:hypothetical protein
MKNLGIKNKTTDMYPSMVGEDKENVRYPYVRLPLSLMNGDVDLEQEITLVFKGKITRVEKSEYAEEFEVELLEGEVKESEKTLLG